jgi:hypothetical protein
LTRTDPAFKTFRVSIVRPWIALARDIGAGLRAAARHAEG